jgi:hypothetical protein
MRHLDSFIRTLGTWLGPRSKRFDLARTYAVGAAIAFFYLYVGNIYVEPGATEYIDLAQAMLSGGDLKGHILNGAWGRDIGMSLIWIISGFPLTGSLSGVVIIQVMMGLAMPLLSYLALHPWFPRTAYYTALALTLSLAPILLSKFIHHDQPYIFFTVVSLYFCSRYMLTKSPSYLYALGASVFGLVLIRQAGTGLFWLLIPVCGLWGGVKSYKHIAAAALIFVGASMAYSKYRASMQGETGGPGVQLFYNIYINSSEFGVRLSPFLGPNVKFIINRVHDCLLPSPATSPYVRSLDGPPDFINHFYKYTADELVEKISARSNTGYYNFISGSGCLTESFSALDDILLGASWEIARAHPIYVVRLFLRNSFQLLYNPGWLHNDFDFSTYGEIRGGLFFPLYNIFGTTFDKMPEPALSEAGFIPLARQSELIKDVQFTIYWVWYRSYHPMTIILGCLAWFAWISTMIGLLQKAGAGARLARWSQFWLSDQVIPASVGISVLLLANVAITAISVDPRYRYDFSLLILKFMLAGVGGAVLIELLKRFGLREALFVFFRRISNQRMPDKHRQRAEPADQKRQDCGGDLAGS